MGQTYVCVDNVWRPCSSSIVNVKYMSSYGTVPPQEITLSSIAVTIPSCGTRIGYDFLGWSTINGASTAEYDVGETCYFSKNITLYAVWKAKIVTLTYYTQLSASTQLEYTYGTIITLMSPTPYNNITPLGWTDNSSSNVVKYGIGDTLTITSNITLHAIYKKPVFGGFIIEGNKYGVSYTIPSTYNGYNIEEISIGNVWTSYPGGSDATWNAVIDGKTYANLTSGSALQKMHYNACGGIHAGSTISITANSSSFSASDLVFRIDFNISSSVNALYSIPNIIVISS